MEDFISWLALGMCEMGNDWPRGPMPDQNFQHDIFLSYAREDQKWVKSFAEILKKLGWSVWYNRRIPTGQTYGEVIVKALRDANVVIVIWTSSSVRSHWVKNEARIGLNRGRLFPVMVGNVEGDVSLDFHHLKRHNCRIGIRKGHLRYLINLFKI
jgi:hypothetical protein